MPIFCGWDLDALGFDQMNAAIDIEKHGKLELHGVRRRIDVLFGFGMAIFGLVCWCAPEVIDLPGKTAEIAGAILAVVGVLTVAYRSGSVIDRENNTVTLWWGFPFPVFRETEVISPTAVRLGHRISHSDAASWSRFPVFIVSDDDEFEVISHHQPIPAWTVAQDIARFLNVELIDESEEGIYEFLPCLTRLWGRWRRRKARAAHPL